MKLTVNRKDTGKDWDSFADLEPHEYLCFVDSKGEKCGYAFKCPGCGEPLAINNQHEPNDPHWTIDFNTMTATPSILHSRNGKGCGWHGYLTNGELVSC